MNEKLQQVARALKAFEAEWLLDTNCVNPSGPKYEAARARAAVEAMRVPTAAQGMAMYAAWDAFGENASMGPAEAIALYQAAIDEALK